MNESIEYYNNGKIKSVGILNESKREGLWKFYFEDGKLEKEISYLNGKHEGLWKEYYENGKVKEETLYKSGIGIVVNFWLENGEQTLINGTGYKIEKYGALERDVYKQYFEKGEFLKEDKIDSLIITGYIFPKEEG
jgi:antitoxin component YwqK of YwqJK toxin-antitoxin module